MINWGQINLIIMRYDMINWGQINLIIMRYDDPMARQPRLTVPDYPHHIIQRGNNRQAIFGGAADYQALLGD